MPAFMNIKDHNIMQNVIFTFFKLVLFYAKELQAPTWFEGSLGLLYHISIMLKLEQASCPEQ